MENYDDYRRCARTLVNDLERAQYTLVIRKKKAADKERMAANAEEESTEDAIVNEQHNANDMTWNMGHTGKKNEDNRRRKLMEVFDRTSSSGFSGANNRPILTMLEQHVQS